MKRMHIHISTDDLAASIRFYSQMFGSQPSVQKEDYAKWMLEDPKVNFAISTRPGVAPGLNHLGMQTENAAELCELGARLRGLEQEVIEEADAQCCYAQSDKYWVHDPAGIPWEAFHTLGNIPVWGENHAPQGQTEESAQAGACCAPPKPKMRIDELAKAKAAACCAPGSQCC
ncbi:ArsI/CadI family heavy metal resistance metalloenzyme [Massilia sp. W12]|uniref:ArsI/CadI family heavy metal resistance metalloenzyme n=1 Tax=Massilia sp. W12 TaxID=3126507 RepID=UPI0030D1F2FD